MYTIKQIENGISTEDLNLDISSYAKKTETATKKELNNLSDVLSNKHHKSPQHKHGIVDINELQNKLNRKNDIWTKYTYNAILSDPEKILYLESLTTGNLKIGDYTLNTSNNGDINVLLNDSIVASFDKTLKSWTFMGDEEKDEAISNKNDRVVTGSISCAKSIDGSNPHNALLFGPFTSPLYFKGTYSATSLSAVQCWLKIDYLDSTVYVVNKSWTTGNVGSGRSLSHTMPYTIKKYNDEPYLEIHDWSVE